MIKLKRVLSLIELKKLRLEFSNLIRINSTITKIDHVTDGFICFLGAQVCRLWYTSIYNMNTNIIPFIHCNCYYNLLDLHRGIYYSWNPLSSILIPIII